jgi:predicted HAD superfamily Cof-like phosphohydrolase
MKTQISQVQEFQTAFNQLISNEPTTVSKELSLLRFELMKEENNEYLEAVLENDLVEIADALGDQLYILAGTILTHGMQHIIEPVFNEIHRSNMSKLDASGKPIINGMNGVLDMSRPIGKVIKSKGYSEPNIKQILETKIIPIANSEQLISVGFAVGILEKKIARIQGVGFESYTLTIRILNDLMTEFKEIELRK